MDTFYHDSQLPLFDLTKVCKTCHIEKPLDDFPKDAMGKHGHKAHCKPCYVTISHDSRKKYYLTHPGKHKETYKGARAEYQRNYRRERYRSNRTSEREDQRDRYAKNIDARRENNRKRYRANPLIWIEGSRRRDARKAHARVGRVSYKRIIERYGRHCYICNKPIDTSQKMHFDHVIPLNRGGAHTEENIKPSHDICNLRKSTYLLEELTSDQRRGPI